MYKLIGCLGEETEGLGQKNKSDKHGYVFFPIKGLDEEKPLAEGYYVGWGRLHYDPNILSHALVHVSARATTRVVQLKEWHGQASQELIKRNQNVRDACTYTNRATGERQRFGKAQRVILAFVALPLPDPDLPVVFKKVVQAAQAYLDTDFMFQFVRRSALCSQALNMTCGGSNMLAPITEHEQESLQRIDNNLRKSYEPFATARRLRRRRAVVRML